MKNYAVACTWFKFNNAVKPYMNMVTDLRPINANSLEEAIGKYVIEANKEFPEHQMNGQPVAMGIIDQAQLKEGE